MSKFRFTSRTKARKRAADVVFEADQRGMGRNPEVLRDILRQRRAVTAAQTPLPEYSVRIVEGVADHLRRIDDLISARAKVAGLDRVAAVDLAVMRVAVWEMLENSEDVPAVIAIDEAISIVKSLSTESAPSFVNAVLDAIRKDIEAPAWSRRSSESGGASSAAGDGPIGEAVQDGAETPVATSAEEMSVEDLEELDELLGEY
ncbi:transcription antitermination factor NusB [Schaalia hyovaginalis]|uniref:transcription antitermination factor NusB n=1 Tax=Schaalia hyovaginalis TaxID=29316 RepID=UPI0026F13B23|nr:transcription antitermination factor NusB [Schaalia hyovaginalis]MDD7554860.1 transcription antitermination factor NusB [Schaalia hyovaginalis]